MRGGEQAADQSGALFSAITARLEDMHGLAVEGQSSSLTPQEALCLCTNLREGVRRIASLCRQIRMIAGDGHGQ